MNNHVTLTVFTPTYNRKALLCNCYESLKRQTSYDFMWLVIDDGSNDDTKSLIDTWIGETPPFKIKYIYKENGGLHTAYNVAIEHMNTELCMCIDSDDYLVDDSVECILEKWKQESANNVAGIVALNCTTKEQILGKRLPDIPYAHIIDLYCRYKCRRDLKMIYRTELLKRYGPIPEFPNERYMNPYYLFLKVDKDLPMLLYNKAVCVVNYQDDGMSNDIISQYLQSPNSYAELRRMMMSMSRASKKYVYKQAIHYVSSSLFAKQKHMISTSPQKILTLLALLPGVMLNVVIRWGNRRK